MFFTKICPLQQSLIAVEKNETKVSTTADHNKE